MTTVYLALGSNVGDSRRFIAEAVEQLRQQVSDLVEAPVYASKAVGFTDQPDFVNTAVSGQTNLAPLALLRFVKDIEKHIGRVERFRWGPREIDIDIIFYGDEVVAEPDLSVPHPRFAERDFVLQPLCDLNPGLVDPTSQQAVLQLLAQIPAGARSVLNKL